MTDEEAILGREEEWRAALEARDAGECGGILADDYALELMQPVAARMERDAWLALLPDYVVHAWDVEERLVAVDGDVATVLMRVQMRATVAGEDRSGPFVITDVWRRADGGTWRVWRRHSTPLQAGRLARAEEG
jgi:ketosteroid isomerase-like protein